MNGKCELMGEENRPFLIIPKFLIISRVEFIGFLGNLLLNHVIHLSTQHKHVNIVCEAGGEGVSPSVPTAPPLFPASSWKSREMQIRLLVSSVQGFHYEGAEALLRVQWLRQP